MKLEISNHTCRSWGIDGAGKENLPLATTAWNSQRGAKMILQNQAKTSNNAKLEEEQYNSIL